MRKINGLWVLYASRQAYPCGRGVDTDNGSKSTKNKPIPTEIKVILAKSFVFCVCLRNRLNLYFLTIQYQYFILNGS